MHEKITLVIFFALIVCFMRSFSYTWFSLWTGLISYTEYLFLLTILTSKYIASHSCLTANFLVIGPKIDCGTPECPHVMICTSQQGIFHKLQGLLVCYTEIQPLSDWRCFGVAEPRTGFHIAFKMLDVDGNEHVDNKEFLKVRVWISRMLYCCSTVQQTLFHDIAVCTLFREKTVFNVCAFIMSKCWRL